MKTGGRARTAGRTRAGGGPGARRGSHGKLSPRSHGGVWPRASLAPADGSLPAPASTMALQQAQMLLSMNSLEAANAGAQQNNTESFAVALCHLAELHAEQVGPSFSPVLQKSTGRVSDRSGWLRVAEKVQWPGAGFAKLVVRGTPFGMGEGPKR